MMSRECGGTFSSMKVLIFSQKILQIRGDSRDIVISLDEGWKVIFNHGQNVHKSAIAESDPNFTFKFV